MDVKRTKQIYESEDMFAVQLGGKSVWIENVDVANEMATVRVGSDPLNTLTVSVERLEEGRP